MPSRRKTTSGEPSTPSAPLDSKPPAQNDDLDPVELYGIYRTTGATITEKVIQALKGEAEPAQVQLEADQLIKLLGLHAYEVAMLSPRVSILDKCRLYTSHRQMSDGSKLQVADTRQPQSAEVVEARIAAAKQRLVDIAKAHVVGKATEKELAQALIEQAASTTGEPN